MRVRPVKDWISKESTHVGPAPGIIAASAMQSISKRVSTLYRFQVVSPSSSPQQNMPTSAAMMKKSNSVKYSKIADMACSSYFLRCRS